MLDDVGIARESQQLTRGAFVYAAPTGVHIDHDDVLMLTREPLGPDDRAVVAFVLPRWAERIARAFGWLQ